MSDSSRIGESLFPDLDLDLVFLDFLDLLADELSDSLSSLESELESEEERLPLERGRLCLWGGLYLPEPRLEVVL